LKIGCLLSVREKATRLPGKVLLDIAGKPVTAWLLSRLSMANEIDQVILSTSTHEDDAVLETLAITESFASYRGSEDDKLKRYYDTALAYELDAVVIVDGDDPFCFPEVVDRVALELRSNMFDCVYVSGLPLGAASTGLTVAALRKVLEIKDEEDTEVWGGYFINSGKFDSKEIKIEEKIYQHPEIRLTLDYQEDYEFITKVIEKLRYRKDFSSEELMRLLVVDNPELVAINADAQKRYEAHIQNAAPVKFKEV